MKSKSQKEIETFQVIIVGAGIAGIAAAYQLGKDRPDSNYVVLEALDTFGGTWYTHN